MPCPLPTTLIPNLGTGCFQPGPGLGALVSMHAMEVGAVLPTFPAMSGHGSECPLAEPQGLSKSREGLRGDLAQLGAGLTKCFQKLG